MQKPTSNDFSALERATAVIDDKREAVASGIDSAASALASKADSLPGGEKVANAAWTTAEALENAAGYVRDQDVESMLSDIGEIVKKHPGATLLTVAALGFVLARAISRH